MEGAASPSLEATLLQRWFPLSPDGTSTRGQDESFSETDLRDISDVLRRVGQGGWSRIPRIYAVLRLLGRLDVIDLFLAQAISDVYFPFTHNTLPQSLNPSVANGFLQLQRAVLSSALDLERETGRHRHFSSANDVPFIKVEELGKGAYGYVDRVVSTISHKEYARKLILRGRTFQRDRKILRDFERELGTLKKLRHHRHIVQLVGSYTDPRYVGILMSPVAECDLKEFLHNCTSESSGQHSRRSFMRSFFGCLTSALSYLHDNTVRHKDIKPQNILVSQHTVYLTDFGISLDWSEIGQSTTTGPTPKTARYCAPEVSDYAPRNTSSDMWSLGCIFLEIWTVLKGESVTKLHAFLETHGERSSCYHLNNDATSDWIKMLESKPTLADNPPQAWIQHLLVEDKQKRWTARHLLSEIESINNDPDTKFAFSGQCCLEELESAESVVSSHGSIGEATARDSEAQLPPPAVSLSANTLGNSAGGMPLEGSAISRGLDQDDQNKEVHGPGTVDSVIKVTPPNGSDGITSIPPAVESELDSTTLTEKSIISPVASWLALQNASKEEEGVLIAMGESPEKGPHTALSHKNEEDSASSGLQPQADELGRPHSTHPEVILALRPAEDILADVTTYPTPVQDTVSGLIASETYPLDQQDEVNSRAASTLKSSSSQRTVDFVPQRFAENTASSPPTLTKEDPNIQHETIWLPYSRHPARTSEQKQQSNGPTSTAVDPPPTALEQQVSSRLTTPYSGPDTDILAFQNSHVIKTKPRFNCEKCSEPLTGQFVKIPPRNQRFHLECFTCADCDQIVASKFFPVPGKIIGGKFLSIADPPENHTQQIPLCEDDYFRRLDLICHSCGRALRGNYISAMNNKYHVEHFTCVAPGCGKVFDAEDSYYEHEDAVYCKSHYASQRAQLCHGCGTAIFKQFVEIARTGKTQFWHPECYMIHKYWNVTLKNEFAEVFAKRLEAPKVNGVELTPEMSEASLQRTEVLTHRAWAVLSYFEESCATSLSDMLLHVSKSEVPSALSASAAFIPKVEKFFATLEKLNRLQQAQDNTGIPMTRELKLFCKKLASLFSYLASNGNGQGTSLVTQELLSTVTGIAHYLKLLVRIGLKTAMALDPDFSRGVIMTWLTDVEKATQTDLPSYIQLKIERNAHTADAYLYNFSSRVDVCNTCKQAVDTRPGSGCILNGLSFIYHIECQKCPSCNGTPRCSYDLEGQPFVECSECSYGGMMNVFVEKWGPTFILLGSRSLVFVHLLYVAWCRLAKNLVPDFDKFYFARAMTDGVASSGAHKDSSQDGSFNTKDAPPGWKAYWSPSVGRYVFMNLKTGISQWEPPFSNAKSITGASTSQELVSQPRAPLHDLGDPDATLTDDILPQQPLSLDDITGMGAPQRSYGEYEAISDSGPVEELLEAYPSRHAPHNAAHHASNSSFDFLSRIGGNEGGEVLNNYPPPYPRSPGYDNRDGGKKKGFFDRLRRRKKAETGPAVPHTDRLSPSIESSSGDQPREGY